MGIDLTIDTDFDNEFGEKARGGQKGSQGGRGRGPGPYRWTAPVLARPRVRLSLLFNMLGVASFDVARITVLVLELRSSQ